MKTDKPPTQEGDITPQEMLDKRTKCFISAPYGLDLSILQRALEENNVDWQWAQNLSDRTSLMESISAAVNDADFVLAVFVDETAEIDVSLEVGYAFGRGVPVAVLTTSPLKLPFELPVFRLLKTDLQNTNLLIFQVGLLLRGLESLKRSRQPTLVADFSNTKKAKGNSTLELFNSALKHNIASAIISAGGWVTVPDMRGGEQAADLLMWLPEQNKELFNPAAVEAKKIIGVQEMLDAQIQLGKYVLNSGFGCGLIIVNSVALAHNLSNISPYPHVFLLSFSFFKRMLEKGELASWILQERNRLVHGAR